MKKIEAFIRPERIGEVRKALVEAGHRSMINYDIWYRGTEKEITQGTSSEHSNLYDFMPKIKIELMADDASVQEIVSAICGSAHTGCTGDGKIFISPIVEAIRIQTRESGDIVL